MDEGIIITPGLQVTLAPRSSVRDDEVFVSREDAPALIEKIQALLLPKDKGKLEQRATPIVSSKGS